MLQLSSLYSRKDVHSIFSPDTVFVPQAGTWGLQGIVDVSDRPGDYVFFVTFGKAQGAHQFDEFVTEDGVLSWQSQPKQGLNDRKIRAFIRHREEVNNIHLFLRTTRDQDYTYFGRLKYLDHDPSRERPVYFQWQILDWPPSAQVLGMLAAAKKLVPVEHKQIEPPQGAQDKHQLIETAAPKIRKPGRVQVEGGATVRAKRPDYLANQAANLELGFLGELLVVRKEQERLTSAGRPDLAGIVRHVSVIENDTAGYDILSYDEDGTKRFIEVKTTRGSIDSDFFISASELAFSAAHGPRYHLYRLYDYSDDLNSANFYVVTGEVEANARLLLAPTNFKVSLRREDE